MASSKPAPRLALGENRVHVLTRNFGLAHGVVHVPAHEAGHVRANAFGQRFFAKIGAPRKGNHHGLDGRVLRAKSQ